MTQYIHRDSEFLMLTIFGLTYRIGGRVLLDQASAPIAEGSKVGLVGGNGAGKSTLPDLIRGVLQPGGGRGGSRGGPPRSRPGSSRSTPIRRRAGPRAYSPASASTRRCSTGPSRVCRAAGGCESRSRRSLS